jgi:spermidine/putrescine transport system substrate-binding protein
MRGDFRNDRQTAEPTTRELVGLTREVSRGGITRRDFVVRALGLGLTASAAGALLAACGGGGSTSASGSPTPLDTTKPSTLYLYNWSDYIAPNIKKDFQSTTGIKIVESYFDDNEALLAKLKAGATGYDVIVPSDYMIHIMIESGLLIPLHMDQIPNFKYVNATFQRPVYDDPAQNGGNKYSVPYQWGTTGIGYAIAKVAPAPSKWADLFAPVASPFKGQVNMLNDERETPGAALKMLGFSLNTTDQTQLDAATTKLIEQKPLVRQYDSINMKRALIAGTPLVHTWNGDALLAMDAAGTDKVGYALPQEGYTVWVDNLAIPQGVRSQFGAHLFMNFILDPKRMAELTDWIWYLPPEKEAEKYMTTKLVLDNIPSAADLQRGEVINDVGNFARNYTDAWAKVKSS